jgi:RNA polymerase sigma-70 factor (ECF subfamily)
MPDLSASTSATLLGRLRDPADRSAWPEFVDRYGPQIHGWCKAWKLQEADAADVTQEVLLKLVTRLRTFHYDPAQSFCGWLCTVTQHVLCDMRHAQRRAVHGSGDRDVHDLLDKVESREDLAKRLEAAFDEELLQLAERRVQCEVAPTTWQAYVLLAKEGRPAKEAAARLGEKKVNTVIVNSLRVQRRLREAIARLERSAGEGKQSDP